MKIGIIDADLISRNKHRFPNLACEKIAGYHKRIGDDVTLITKWDYFLLLGYDKVYISKVFTDTVVPDWCDPETIKETLPNVSLGGSGFYFDSAEPLPCYIEHHMPDYSLYNDWIEETVTQARNEQGERFNEKKFRQQFKEYTDYSIGFLTRGCFRKCGFCINKKYDRVSAHSPLDEFYDPNKKKICLLDDNFLGIGKAKAIEMLNELKATGKPFKFKQGIDERLISDEVCNIIFNSNYDGDITFAFDSINDYEIIESKLKIIKRYAKKKSIKFYVLVGFESTDETDIENAFKRVELLMRYGCLPYVMRYQSKEGKPYLQSKYKDIYITLARWANQPRFIKKMSFREFCYVTQGQVKSADKQCTALRSMISFEREHKDIAQKYFDLKWDDLQI